MQRYLRGSSQRINVINSSQSHEIYVDRWKKKFLLPSLNSISLAHSHCVYLVRILQNDEKQTTFILRFACHHEKSYRLINHEMLRKFTYLLLLHLSFFQYFLDFSFYHFSSQSFAFSSFLFLHSLYSPLTVSYSFFFAFSFFLI